MTVKLVAFTRKGLRRDFPIQNGATIIGRTTEAQIQIPLQEVSRKHCQISLNEGKVRLRDLSSSNGTFVNEHKVSEAILHAGDRLRVGPVTFLVQIDGVPQDVKPAMLAGPPGAASVPAAAKPAPPEATTKVGTPPQKAAADAEEDLDLEDLDAADLSDFDIEDISPMSPAEGSSEIGEIEEIDELEELGEDDLIPDDEEEDQGPRPGKK